MRLFCLPYAGGGASIYHSWHASFPESVDVCPIELPGRLGRLREAPFREIRALVEALNAALDRHFDLPFAFFGYSLGALIAFEWARELARVRGLEPAPLIVAARSAPQLRPSFFHRADSMSDRDFIARVVALYGPRIQLVLSDPEMVTIMLRMLRADLGMLDVYEYRAAPKLRTPILVLGGERDEVVARESLQRWGEHTEGRCDVRLFAGDHFFIHTHKDAVISAVRASMESSTELWPGRAVASVAVGR